MRVLVVGSGGNMGKRYCAILRYLGHDVLQYDPIAEVQTFPGPDRFDSTIIATPIPEHARYLKMLMDTRPILCEKPLSCDLKQAMDLSAYAGKRGCAAYMVNNWAFVGQHREPMSERKIVVNCYNTGADGDWDLIQPLYLVEEIDKFECVRTLPYLSVEISGQVYGRDDFDLSYIDMVRAFVDGDYGKLWPVAYMLTAHERVVEYGQR